MNNLRLMPDFTANNVATSVGEALAELERRQIEAEQVRFKVIAKNSAYGEILGQSPVSDTYIDPEQEIILKVNAWGRRRIIFSDLLQRLSRRLQIPETRLEASNHLQHLLVDMNASNPSTIELSLMETINQWFESYSVPKDIVFFGRKFLTAETDELLEAVENANENIIQGLVNILSNIEFAKTLTPFFSDVTRKKIETGKSRFSFFQAETVRNTETTLSPAKKEDWESFKNYLVHVYARIELKENLTHEELLDFFTDKFVMPIVYEGFKQSLKSMNKNIQPSHPFELTTELESDIVRKNLTTDLALTAGQPTNLWHMQELFAKYLKLKPNEIKLKIEEKKAIFTFPRKKSKKNNLMILWLDYLFCPLGMEIEYKYLPIRKKVEEVKPVIQKINPTYNKVDDLSPPPFQDFSKWLIYFIIFVFVVSLLSKVKFQESLSSEQITAIQVDSQNLIFRYYYALNIINPEERYKKAVKMWSKPPSNFRGLVNLVEVFETPRVINFEISSANKARVSVVVRGTIRGNNKVHLYKVFIFVEKIDEKWKIKAINNRN